MNGLTPYDTGERLEPMPWVTSTQGLGKRGDPDDWGKVDFDNDEGDTVLTLYVKREGDGTYTLVVENPEPIRIVSGDTLVPRPMDPTGLERVQTYDIHATTHRPSGATFGRMADVDEHSHDL